VRIALDVRYLGMVIGHRANAEMLMGIGAYSYQLARHLIGAGTGDQFFLVTDSSARQIAELLPGAAVLTIPAGWRLPLARATVGRLYRGLVSDRLALGALNRRYRFDIMHHLNPDIMPQPGAALRTVVTVHDMSYSLFPEQVFRNGASRRVWAFQARTWSRSGLIVTDSEATRRDVIKHCLAAPERVMTIHCGADDRFSDVTHPDDAAALMRHGIHPPYFLHVGSIQPSKNIDNLLTAMAIIAKQDADIRLVIVGELSFFPLERKRMERLVTGLGLGNRVHCTGFVSVRDLPAIYRHARALVHPSWYEGFGLTPVEAGACGCPAVISDRGSLPEVMGRAGLSIDPAKPEAIAAGMREMLDDGVRERYARLSKRQAGRYSWRVAAARVRNAYQSLLD